MNLQYEIKNGIGILGNPQAIDLSARTEIVFEFDRDGLLEINKLTKVRVIDKVCSIPIKTLNKGTITLRLITTDNAGKEAKVYPLQPIYVYDIADKLHCTLAMSLDLQKEIESLRLLTATQQSRIITLETNTECIDNIKTKVNELVEIINSQSERIHELEKNYDPTII